MEHTVLLDAPGEPIKRVQVAKLGDYTDKRYGDFSITPTDYEDWKRNLAVLPGGEALIDLEHRSERKPRDSKAAGWITDLQLDGDKVMADVRWTPLGEENIRNGIYRFMSPTFGPYTNETGETFDNTLVSAALTNKPFLGSMAAVTLASPERVSEAVTAELLRLLSELDDDQRTSLGIPAQATEPAADSRRSMDAKTLTLLDLDENATDEAILAAVTGLKAKADQEPAPTKTLEQQAAESGKRLLDADTLNQLVADAAAGREAADQLKTERREQVWKHALEQLVRVPAQRESFDKLYALDAQAATEMIEADIASGHKLLNARPADWDNTRQQGGSETKELSDLIAAKRTELNCDYQTAYLRVLDDIERGDN